jgi:protein gp37
MAKNSEIAWTDHTWNPWQGCHKVSPGCDNCYMERDKKRYGKDPETVVRSSIATFNKPNHWIEPAMVFVCSWSDFFIEEADAWRDEAWAVIRNNPHLTFQILTKRPENMLARVPMDLGSLKNVWLGVTCENHEQALERLEILTMFNVPVRFASVEPMLGIISLRLACQLSRIDWVICGGESGPNAREMKPYWAEDLMEQCYDAAIPFFMKQMSGSKKSDREAIPENLQVRQFPKART